MEREPIERFDWHHADLVKNPPYNQADMIHQLVDGRFIIEGKQSGIEDAQLFADMLVEEKKDTPELWDALDHHTLTPDKLLAGNIF